MKEQLTRTFWARCTPGIFVYPVYAGVPLIVPRSTSLPHFPRRRTEKSLGKNPQFLEPHPGRPDPSKHSILLVMLVSSFLLFAPSISP